MFKSILAELLMDIDTYRERLIAVFEGEEGLTVDTCRVSDGQQPYETGIEHPEYNEGAWVIVEAYDTPEEAQGGHERWVRIMTDDPPAQLVDCCNSEVAKRYAELGGITVFPRRPLH